MKNEYWTTASGHKLSTADMTEDHLHNVLNQIIRREKKASSRRIRNMISQELHDMARSRHWGY